MVMTPIFLVYFLIDGEKTTTDVRADHPENDRRNITSLLVSLNQTVSRYISGISIDALIIGTLAFIGYSFIGLKYALVFAIFLSLG